MLESFWRGSSTKGSHGILSQTQFYLQHKQTINSSEAMMTNSLSWHTISRMPSSKRRLQTVLAVFVDLSKAFDNVWKEGLLLKLLRQPIVSVLWEGGVANLIFCIYLSVAAHTTVCTDLFLRFTSMLLRHKQPKNNRSSHRFPNLSPTLECRFKAPAGFSKQTIWHFLQQVVRVFLWLLQFPSLLHWY